jgi:hypothetical protein
MYIRMKTIALMIMLVALFFLYRIAFPKRIVPKTDEEKPQKPEADLSEVIIKSRFVRPASGQSATNRTTPLQTDFQHEKPPIFAVGNEERSAVVPPEKVRVIFLENEPDPDGLEIVRDEHEESDNEEIRDRKDDEDAETANLEEEAEELRQTLGSESEHAGSGLSIEELTEAAAAVENPTDDKGAILFKVEKTDMFEQMVSGDAGKAERIKAIIDRHVRNTCPEVENENSDDVNNNDWKNFDLRDYL